jgi:quinolinate synthase
MQRSHSPVRARARLANIKDQAAPEGREVPMQELPTIQGPSAAVPGSSGGLSPAEIAELSAEVKELAVQRDAVILAHNYELPELQDLADYVGDSLGLSRAAAATEAAVIAFCGVHFMAETASVLSPEKTVLIPDLNAGCSLADSITADQLRAWKAEHPGAVVVMYVNTSAEVKAETDYCCTSSNAVDVVDHIWQEHGPETEILFGPDMWLGAFVERETGLLDDPERRARFHVWDGECHVHAGIRPDDINAMRADHPEAEFLIHPECGCSTQAMEYVAAGDVSGEGVHMLSTSGMLQHVEQDPDGSYIVATETGMLYPLREAAPGANLIAANRMAFCRYMKMITLPKLRDCLRDMTGEVKVSPEIAAKARIPIERMVAIG